MMVSFNFFSRHFLKNKMGPSRVGAPLKAQKVPILLIMLLTGIQNTLEYLTVRKFWKGSMRNLESIKSKIIGNESEQNKPGTAQVGAISKAQQKMWHFGEKSIMLYEKWKR